MTLRLRAAVCAFLCGLLCAASVAADTIGLAWDASPDDGVIGYRVYRDGVLIAATTALTVQGIVVSSGTSALFGVTALAIDSSGNLLESEPSTVMYTAFIVLPLDNPTRTF